jgi:plasmid replication initiation protein
MKNRNLYKMFLNYNYDDLIALFKQSKTREEQDFYTALANMFSKGS